MTTAETLERHCAPVQGETEWYRIKRTPQSERDTMYQTGQPQSERDTLYQTGPPQSERDTLYQTGPPQSEVIP